MADHLVHVADDFWNVRGSFRIAGLLDIGTQCSLVRLRSGRFVLLDSYPLTGRIEDEVLALTDDGRAVEAVLNLHPFHTIHVAATHAQFPEATLYGTARHKEQAPELPWAEADTDGPEVAERYADDLDLLVPDGVVFVHKNPNVHFASVLALHRQSRTLHVDDTLTYTKLPLIGGLTFHPTLGRVLLEQPGAAEAFRTWAEDLIARCAEVDHLCTAHTRPLPPGGDVASQVRSALDRVESTLSRHAARWG